MQLLKRFAVLSATLGTLTVGIESA